MQRAHPSSGFSLVETLVAMAIFMLAIGVLAKSANNALLAIGMMEIKEGRGHDYAFVRDQMLTISDTQSLSLGGDVPTPTSGQAHWDAETETTDTPDLFKITLNVTLSGKDGEDPETAAQTLFLLRPQWSQTDDRSTLLGSIHDSLGSVRTQQAWP